MNSLITSEGNINLMEGSIKIWYKRKFGEILDIDEELTFNSLFVLVADGINEYDAIGVYDFIVHKRIINELIIRLDNVNVYRYESKKINS